MSFPRRQIINAEPNHRQEVALERIEFAISELATILLACSSSREAAQQAIAGTRAAIAPVIAAILSLD